MFGIVRYSIAIIASLCAVALDGEHAFGQVLQGNAEGLSVEQLRANVLSFDPGGTHIQVAAAGMRNCEGMTVQPATGELWCIVNERDELSDNFPREYKGGAFVARDGSLIMTEDGNGTIWKVTYRGGTRTPSDAGGSVRAGNDAAKGNDLYIANCSACHLANGEGIPGAFPPLKGSGVVNKGDAAKHIQIVLNGMQGARAGGVVYASAMSPFAGVLSNVQIADIIDYERSSWGNHGTPVNTAQVAAERARAK